MDFLGGVNIYEIFYPFVNAKKDEKKSGKLKAAISNLANVYWSSYKPTQNTLRKHGILKKLRIRKDILIVRPNKGNGVVILD